MQPQTALLLQMRDFFEELREVISKSSADLLGKDHIKRI